MKIHSYLLVGTTLKHFVSMLIRNRGFSYKHLNRILFILNAGLWSSIFAFVEKLSYKQKIENEALFDNPIFIIGNWRTGSTYLFQLLSLDPQFNYPTFFQASNPDHLLVSKRFFGPVMSKFIGNKRPMDNVRAGIDEPQEDEYALIKICKESMLEDFVFSKRNTFFLDGITDFSPRNEKAFINALKQFLKKINLSKKGQNLLKNPFHSLRIPMLNKAFPKAKYIHIYRNPKDVVPSTIHMWNIFGTQNILKGKWQKPNIEQIANLYKHIVNTIRSEFPKLKKGQYVEIKYEELEINPVENVKLIYEQLNLHFTLEYEHILIDYCKKNKDYKKNKFNLTEKELESIKRLMQDTFPEYY